MIKKRVDKTLFLCYNKTKGGIDLKCRNCGKEIEKEYAFKIGKASYYCNEDCYNEKLSKQKKQKIKYEPKENTERRDYTDYILRIYLENGYNKSEINWTLLMSQTKNILQEHKDWSYNTLQYILYYMYEIELVNLFSIENNGSILNLLPYYGLEAEKYYNELCDIENEIDGFDFSDNVSKIKKPKSTNKIKYKEISISGLKGD